MKNSLLAVWVYST